MFQTRLRELREAAGYRSQQSFANAFGVAQSTVGGWEAGKREPNYETTMRLAQFFGVSIDYLLGVEKEKESIPIVESRPAYPPGYDLLSPGDQALIDNMIRSLSRKQLSGLAEIPIPPKDKTDSETAQGYDDIEREVEDYRRRLIQEKNQAAGSSPLNGAGSETA